MQRSERTWDAAALARVRAATNWAEMTARKLGHSLAVLPVTAPGGTLEPRSEGQCERCHRRAVVEWEGARAHGAAVRDRCAARQAIAG